MRLLTTILLFVSFTCLGQGLILEKVVAKVGGEDIFYSDVQELYGYAKAQNPDYDSNIQCRILEQLLSSKLLLDQAKIDSIFISDAELEVQVDKRMDYILGQMGGDEQVFLEYYGKTPIEQREEMKEPMREKLIQERIQGSLIRDVEITPNEVIAFFDQIPPDSLPYLPAEVELGEISMKTIISEEAKTSAYSKLDKVRSRIINDGESFAELASLFSDDGSAQNGGDLGWAKRGAYVPEFEATAFSLEPGEISEIIETKFGYHLLELLERRGNNIKVRHILIKPEITPDDITKTKNLLDSVKTLIMNDSITFEVAVKRYGDDEVQSFSNSGRLINPGTGDTFWETGQLPFQTYFAIEKLALNEISEVVEMEEYGEKNYKIYQLQTKTKPHRASLKTDYTKIKNFAIESKKNEYFNEWMEKKINSTLIDVSPKYNACPNLEIFTQSSN